MQAHEAIRIQTFYTSNPSPIPQIPKNNKSQPNIPQEKSGEPDNFKLPKYNTKKSIQIPKSHPQINKGPNSGLYWGP